MIPRISRTAVELLVTELQETDFEKKTLGRLLVENPSYAYLANLIAQRLKSEFGIGAYNVATTVFACSYRAIELGHRHPEQRHVALPSGNTTNANMYHEPSIESATDESKAAVVSEWNNLLERMKHE